MKTCLEQGCGGAHYARGLCKKHYQRVMYRANPQPFLEKIALYRQNNVEVIRARKAAAYKKNPESIKARAAKWAVENRQKHNERNAKWAKENKESINAKTARYAKRYPEKDRARNSKRKAAKRMAVPAWANDFFIEEIYDLAQRRTKALGVKHHVDHRVPLQSPLVCGLHVEANLRVIPAFDNLSKRNRWWPDMPDDLWSAKK